MVTRLRLGIVQFLEKRPLWFFIGAAFVVGFVYWFAGPYSFIRLGDVSDHDIPRYVMMADQVRGGDLGRWIPRIAMGADRAALDVYPWNLGTMIFSVLPPVAGYIVLMLLVFFVAGWSLYHFLHKRLGVSVAASAVGALLFMLYLLRMDSARFPLGLAITPVALYWIDVVMASSRRLLLLTIVPLGFVVAFFNTLVVTLPYILAAIMMFTVMRYGLRRPKALLVLLLLTLAAFGFYFDQVRWMASIMQVSNRSLSLPPFVLSGYGAHVIDELTSYGFPLIFAAAVWAIFARRRETNRETAYAMIGKSLIAIVLILVVAPLEFHRFPGVVSLVGKLGAFQIGRILVVAPLFVSIIAAYSLDVLGEARLVYQDQVLSLRRIAMTAAVILLIVLQVSLTIGIMSLWFKQRNSFAYLRHPDLLRLAEESRTSPMPFRVIGLGNKEQTLSDGFLELLGLDISSGVVNTPLESQRTWWEIIDRTDSVEMKISFGFYSNDGPHGHELSKRLEMQNINDSVNLTLLGLANVKYIVATFPLRGSGLIQVNQPMRRLAPSNVREKIRYAVSDLFTAPPPLFIYRLSAFTDRFFLASGVQVMGGRDQLTAALDKKTTDELRVAPLVGSEYATDVVPLTERKDAKDNKRQADPGKVEVTRVKSDTLALHVTIEQPKLLVVMNQFSPFWHVSVDGVPRTLIPVYGNFWSVVVQPGDTEVVFQYGPR